MDTSESKSEIPWKFLNVALEKEGEYPLEGSNEKLSGITLSWRKGTSHIQYKEGRLTVWDNALELPSTRVGTLIATTVYLQLIQNRYMFRSFTVLHCSHQHCVQHVASDVEVVGYL